MTDDCVFCKIASGEIKESKFIYENDNFFSMPDANPVTRGHSLIISKKHFETILDLPATLGIELLDCVKNTALKIIEKEKAQGFHVFNNNFSAAHQVVKHMHLHIIPRKKNDGLDGKLA
ncbi:MAG: HIT domain-containing protein [Nanoarchaeota archaeon]